MKEGEYNYKIFQVDKGKRLDLGKYTNEVAGMYGEILGLSRLGNGNQEELPEEQKDLLAELEAACDDYWIAVIVGTNAVEEVMGYGALSYLHDQKTLLELNSTYVKPEYRRRGIYKELFHRRLDIARQLGATEVRVIPLPNANHVPYLIREGFHPFHKEGPLVIYRRKI